MPSTIRKSASKISNKQRSEIEGSFRLKARRTRISQVGAKGSSAAVCSGCGAVYFDKHWHSCSEPACKLKAAKMPKTLCEECRLTSNSAGQRASEYAGEVVIEGVTDQALYQEIKNLALNVAKRAEARDPEERIVGLIEEGGRLVIRTTENQLAVSIGKQVHSARKGGKLTITWSREDKPVRVHWTAGE